MAAISSNGTGGGNWSSTATWSGGVVPCLPVAITNCTSSGGLIEITLTSAVTWATNDNVNIYGVTGTTEANGNWSLTKIDTTHFTLQGSTFTNAYVSGGTAFHGDTVTIANGDTVTVDSGSYDASNRLIIGVDSGTALTIASSGGSTYANLTIPAGAFEFRVRGNILHYGQNTGSGSTASNFTVVAGASLVMDPPSGSQWYHNFFGFAQLIFNGTVTNGCTYKTDTARGGSNAYHILGTQGTLAPGCAVVGGLMTATYTTFTNFGNRPTYGYGLLSACDINVINSSGSGNFVTGNNITITNCTFNNANWIALCEPAGGNYWDGNLAFTNNTFTSSNAISAQYPANTCWALSTFGGHQPSAGTRLVDTCVFDLSGWLDKGSYTTIQNCVYAEGLGGANSLTFTSGQVNNNLIVWLNSTIIFGSGCSAISLANNYLALPSSTIFPIMYLPSGSTFTGNIWHQVSGTLGSNPLILAPTAGITATLNLVLPSAGSGTTGYFILPYGSSGSITIEHNTFHGDVSNGRGHIALGAEGAAYAGQVASGQGNIIWYTSATNNYLITETSSSTYTLDAVTKAGHNTFFNPTSGTCKYAAGASSASINGYNQLEVSNSNAFPNAQLGQGDQSSNPKFVDSTRTVISWNVAFGSGTGTWAAALAYLQSNPSKIAAMIKWVKQGFIPTAATVVNAFTGDTQTVDSLGNAANNSNGALNYVAPFLPSTPYPSIPPAYLTV